jgi:hypothetical protein
MAIRLTKTEIQLLKELNAAGEHGQRIAGTSSEKIAHLVRAHCIKRLPGMKVYSITKRGRRALAVGAVSQR